MAADDLPFVSIHPAAPDGDEFVRRPSEQVRRDVGEAAIAALDEAVVELNMARREWELFFFEPDKPTAPGVYPWRTGCFSGELPGTVFLDADIPLDGVRETTRHEIYHGWQHEQGQASPLDEAPAYAFARKGSR